MDDVANNGARITETDMEIIRCLHDDARMSIVQIAKKINVPESTVRSRLTRLTENGILNFVAVTDLFKLGYRLWIMITIQTELTKIDEVARRLSELPEIYFVAVTTGGYDMIVSASFRSNEEFLEFVSTKLSRIPGIIRTANYSLLKIYKREMNVLPPPINRTQDRNGQYEAGSSASSSKRSAKKSGKQHKGKNL